VGIIDRASDRPAYKQIADDLRQRITSGDITPGSKLPSEREMTGQYAASRLTVRQAVSVLRAEGLVDAQHGRGLYVRTRPPMERLGRARLPRPPRQVDPGAFLADGDAMRRQPKEQGTISRGPVPQNLAEYFGVEPGTEVWILRRLMFVDGEPMQMATSYLPLDLVVVSPIERANGGPDEIYQRFDRRGRGPVRFVEVVSARMPMPDEQYALKLGAGVPVISIVRTAYDADGRAIEVEDTRLAANRYELKYEIPAD
jgi:GntR family transcriptional regulator